MPTNRPTRCLFESRQQPFALDVDRVVEIVEPAGLVRLPLGPPPLLGLSSFRGGVVPVAWTGEGERPSMQGTTSEVAVLVVRGSQGLWGLAIDRAGVSVAVEGWESPPGEPSLAGFLSLQGEIRRDGKPYRIIDAERTWERMRSAIVGWYGELSGCDSIPTRHAQTQDDPDPSESGFREDYRSC